jgi:oligosaccharide repeat unit polymerase
MIRNLQPSSARTFRGMGFLGPSHLFFIFWFVGVLLPISPFINENDGFSLYWPYSFVDKIGSLKIALLVYVGVLIFFLLGGAASSLFIRPKPSKQFVKIIGLSFEARAKVVVAAGMLSILLLVYLLGGVGNWLLAGGDRIRQFAGLNFVVLIQNGLLSVSLAWFIKIASKGRSFTLRNHLSFINFSLCALLIIALQGAKSTLFVYLMAMLVVWHVKIRSISFVRLSMFGALCFVMLMIYHVIKQEYLVVGYFVFYNEEDGFFVSFFRMLYQQFTGNLMQLQCMTVLVDAMPEQLDYQFGATLKMVFQIWLPSLIFPDKPPTAPGVFTLALWPEKWFDEATTMPPGLFGEFYMNFGWMGALIGAFFAGFICGVIYRRAIYKDNDVQFGAYALLAGVMLHYFRGELASVTVLYLSLLVPLIWILKGSPKAELQNRRVNR